MVRQPGFVDRHRHPEVTEAGARFVGARRIEEDIGGLHVAVHEAGLVDDLERCKDLVEDPCHERCREWAVVPDERCKGSPADKRECEQYLIVLRGPTQGRENVGVLDPVGLLPHEANEARGIHLPQQLCCYIGVLPMVPGTPDHARTARPERVDELVAAGKESCHGVEPRPTCGAGTSLPPTTASLPPIPAPPRATSSTGPQSTHGVQPRRTRGPWRLVPGRAATARERPHPATHERESAHPHPSRHGTTTSAIVSQSQRRPVSELE